MLELLISILMSLGIQFTILESGEVQISPKDTDKMRSSEFYQKSEGQTFSDVIVNDGVDPSSSPASKE